MNEHWPIFTLLYTLAQWVSFFFMAALFPYCVASTSRALCMASSGDAQLRW